MAKYKLSERGLSLLEALVGVAILALLMTGLSTLMTSMHGMNKTLSDNIESYDLERQLGAVLSDEAICACQLKRASPMVAEARSPTGRTGTKSAEVTKITTGCEDSSETYAEAGQTMRAQSGSFKVSRISVRDLVPTGRLDPVTKIPDEYLGAYYIEFAAGGTLSRKPHTVKLSKLFGTSPDGSRLIECASDANVFPGPAVTNTPLAAADRDSVAPCMAGYSVVSGGWLMDGTAPSCPNVTNADYPFVSQNHPVVDPVGTNGWRVQINCVGYSALAVCTRGRQ